MTPREKGLLDMQAAIRNAARRLDIDWPASVLNDPMTTKLQASVCRTYRYDLSKLEQAAQVVDVILLNADGFGVLFELAAKKPKEFAALVVLARGELVPVAERAA